MSTLKKLTAQPPSLKYISKLAGRTIMIRLLLISGSEGRLLLPVIWHYSLAVGSAQFHFLFIEDYDIECFHLIIFHI